ncbi:hypothetical protein JCM10207_003651 [Rhodosporidiobolus poonsookiae]
MANSTSASSGKPPLRQFSISSFLPKPPTQTTAATSSASTSKDATSGGAKRKKRRVEQDEVVLSDDDEDEDGEFKKPALPVKKRKDKPPVQPSKGKGKTAVLDLTSDDEVVASSSSPPPAKRYKGKGKAKAEEAGDDEVKPGAEAAGDTNAMWVDQYGPRDRDDLALHPRKLLDVHTWLCEAFTLPLPPPPLTAASKKAGAPSPKPPPPINPRLAKYRRVLVLSGAAGSAKTATLKVLCDEMDVEVVEWKEGARDEFGGMADEPRESLTTRFTSFLARAGMAPALDFASYEESHEAPSNSSSSSRSSSSKLASSSSSKNKRRLILLEDLPNVSHYPTKLALRSAIAQYLASPRVTCPLVIIISEALARPGADDGGGIVLGGHGGRGDSLDARSVLGVELLQHPACREIAFNPIAATIMRKALQRTLDRIYAPAPSSSSRKSSKASSHSSSSSSKTLTASGLDPSTRPSLATLDLLIQHSSGDVRSALMSLQFLAMQGGDATTSLGLGGEADKGKGKKKTKKRRRGDSSESEDEGAATDGKERVKQLLSFVTARESSLFIFHALGKVLYNKRWGDSADDDKKDLNRPGVLQEREYDKLPKHLRKAGWTRKASKVDPDMLFAEAPLDPDIFLSYLHHNYPPFTDNIDECAGVLEGLSAGDALMLPKGAGAGEGEEAYRRNALTSHYAFQLSVRTTLLALPSPVPRRKQVLRKSELWETLRLARQNEDSVGELLQLGVAGGAGTGAVVYASCAGAPEGVEGSGLATRRERGSLLSEVVPWVGVIQPNHANPFLLDLATFPPLATASQPVVTGTALGEKDLEDEDDDGLDTGAMALPPTSTLAGGRILEELEEEEAELASAGAAATQGLFDLDDDIEE